MNNKIDNKIVIVALSLDDIKKSLNTANSIVVTEVLLNNLGAEVIIEIAKLNHNINFAVDCGDSLSYLLFLAKNGIKYFLLQYPVDANIITLNSTLDEIISDGKIFTNTNNLLEFLASL